MWQVDMPLDRWTDGLISVFFLILMIARDTGQEELLWCWCSARIGGYPAGGHSFPLHLTTENVPDTRP